MSPHKRIPLSGSALFRLTSPRRLAEILLVARSALDRLVNHGDNNYLVRPDKKSGRIIEEPKPQLKFIQQRFARLLAQIETPDVASRARRLLTYGGHLPTGGNASTILSFWAYKPMFDEIAALAKEFGCEFTLYVDDMSITGVFANRKYQQAARKIIARYGLRAHKAKAFSPGQPRVLTGVALTRRGRELPHRRAKGIAQLEEEEALASTASEKVKLLPRLIGKLSEASLVDPLWTGRQQAAVHRRRKLKVAMPVR